MPARKFKVLVAEELNPEGLRGLTRAARVEVKTGLSEADLLKAVADCDALIVRSATQVTRRVLEAGKRLKVVGRAGVGVDNIDVEAATERGVAVVNAPEESTAAAAEHTVAMMLALARRIPQADASMRKGKWERSRFVGVQVVGKTLGVIGLGRVGSDVARKARGLGMRVVGTDPFLSPGRAREMGIEFLPMEKVLAQADFLTLHVPLTSETRHLLGKKELSSVKPGVRVVNASRGGVIDEAALVEALKSGRVAGAALDVFAEEPPKGSPLLSMEQVVLTPHLGASTVEAQSRVAQTIADQVLAALEGRPVRNAINIVTLRPEHAEALGPYLPLAEKVGSLASQLLGAPPRQVEVALHGAEVEAEAQVLSNAALRGALEPWEPGVNLVNASRVAKRKGVQTSAFATEAIEGLAGLVAVKVAAGKAKKEVAGTVFGRDDPRIVKIDGYRVNAVPEGYMIVGPHIDKPRIIGPVGMVMGDARINIAAMQVGRIRQGEEAIMVLNVDAPVTPEILARLRKIDGILDVKLVKL
ncbi:MAG: phosphoglycerate dehydrogenase [Halobacteria archaeon]